MLDDRAGWRATGGWDVVAIAAGAFGARSGDPGVVLRPMTHRAMATIVVRGHGRAAFRGFAEARWGACPADRGSVFGDDGGGLLWSGRDQWLAIAPPSCDLDGLAAELAGIAGVTQQGDGRALVGIGGAQARDVLAKGVQIDLDPGVFPPGSTAITALAHFSVQVWLEADGSAFVLSVPRTVAGSAWNWLVGAAAEYGYGVEPET